MQALTTVGCTPNSPGWSVRLAISLLLVPAVACQMSRVPTLETSYYHSLRSTVSSHMTELTTVKALGWILTLSVEGQ